MKTSRKQSSLTRGASKKQSQVSKRKPTICVLIPVHNMARYLFRAVASAIWQLEPEDEIIVADDGSTDLGGYRELECFSKRIRWLRNPVRKGVSYTRNRAIRRAKAEWIKFLDADDVLAPYALQSLRGVEATLAPDVTVYTGGCHRMYKGEYYDFLCGADESLREIMNYNPILLSATFVRREALLAVGLFDERIEFEEDWDLWLKLHERFGPTTFLTTKDPVCYYWYVPAEREAKIRSPIVDGIPVREYFRRRYGASPL